MNTILQLKDNFFQINIPLKEAYENKKIKEFIDFIRVEQIRSKSLMTDEEISTLSEEAEKNWWNSNREKIINAFSN